MTGSGYRTYEVYQRQRVGESTAPIKPRQLMSAAFQRDPYPLLTTLREHYPCYRDWVGNSFWITRYDDVTSILMDDANFVTRSRRWQAGLDSFGTEVGDELEVARAHAARVDAHLPMIVARLIDDIAGRGRADLAVDVAARLPIEFLACTLDLPNGDVGRFARLLWRLNRSATWEPRARQDGAAAARELADLLTPLLASRRAVPGDDVLSAAAVLDASANDVVVTLLEQDHQTLHGALANLWFLLLTHPDQLDVLRCEPRPMRAAYLEALRHSTPLLSLPRVARHEVERFGRLLPDGALLVCSAAAANRDPRVFGDPDTFDVARADLCQREPRGSYRADGLPSGIAVGLGQPSRHPAMPEDRPRSRYAIARDAAVTVSTALLEALPDLRLTPDAQPELRALRLGEMHTCWHLPVVFTPT